MNRLIGSAFVCVVAFGVAFADEPAKPKEKPAEPEKDTFESVIKLIVKTHSVRADILTAVKDEKAAKESIPKLEKLTGELKALQARMDKIGKPDKEQEKKLQGIFMRDMRKELERIHNQAMRLMDEDFGYDVLMAAKPLPVITPEPKRKEKKPEEKKPEDK